MVGPESKTDLERPYSSICSTVVSSRPARLISRLNGYVLSSREVAPDRAATMTTNLAVRQYNWLTSDAPAAAEATVILRGYKLGEYLSPYMSSIKVEERLSFNERWGATLFSSAAALYGEAPVPLDRNIYPMVGVGLHFLKPVQRMLVNLEYAQGTGNNRGVYVKLGYAW